MQFPQKELLQDVSQFPHLCASLELLHKGFGASAPLKVLPSDLTSLVSMHQAVIHLHIFYEKHFSSTIHPISLPTTQTPPVQVIP